MASYYARRFEPLFRFGALFLGAVLLAGGLFACQSRSDTGEKNGADTSDTPVVEVTAVDYAFAAPDSIRSGWTTFQMENKGDESHHFHLYRLPEGRTYGDFQEGFLAPLDSVSQLVADGKIEAAEVPKVFQQAVSDWAQLANLKKAGGIGLVTPGRTGQATFKLEPGTHVMVCVIRTSDQQSHVRRGMVRPITVTEEEAGGSAPEPEVWVRSSGRDLHAEGTLTPGTQTVGFRAEELPEGFGEGTGGAYSAWLVRLDGGTDIEMIKQWNAQNPAPAEFLGGFEYIPPSQTAYITADLKPGRYAWLWFFYGEDYLGEDQPLSMEFTVE